MRNDPLFAHPHSKYWAGVPVKQGCIPYWLHCAHICKSLLPSLRPGESHIEQTVMRKGITVLHQQLSPVAPVSIKCTYIATGHAVAKEVLVSKQELAQKHPQS